MQDIDVSVPPGAVIDIALKGRGLSSGRSTVPPRLDYVIKSGTRHRMVLGGQELILKSSGDTGQNQLRINGLSLHEHVMKAGGPKPLNPDRPAVVACRAKATLVLRKFFAVAVAKAADQLSERLKLVAKAAKEGADLATIADAQQRATAALADLDIPWTRLIIPISKQLMTASNGGGLAALASLGIQNDEVTPLTESITTEWAQQRAAELVGMRRLKDGTLEANPQARWRIDDTTRDKLRSTVTQALLDGSSADELADRIADSAAFSDTRAEAIARTEIARADMAGALAGYRASGVVIGKSWSTAEDANVSPECDERAKQGVISLDALFLDGYDAPPGHVNCRCTCLPALLDEHERSDSNQYTTKEAHHGPLSRYSKAS